MPRASHRWVRLHIALAATTLACNPSPEAPTAAPPPLTAAIPTPAAEPAPRVDPLPTRTLSAAAAQAATATLAGSWQLVTWVMADAAKGEIPAQARPATAASAEVWHFAESGRFRRTIGDDFAASGRWSVDGSVEPPAQLAWLGVQDWWLVALEDVRIAALPTDVRPREWALVGRDGEERIVFYLGKEPVLTDTVSGARCVRGAAEGQRP